VSESPYFAKTGSDGKAVIDHLPAGDYTVRAWHPHLTVAETATQKNATVADDRHTELQWRLTLKPEIPISRAPAADADGPY
jgi:hypothetical protein